MQHAIGCTIRLQPSFSAPIAEDARHIVSRMSRKWTFSLFWVGNACAIAFLKARFAFCNRRCATGCVAHVALDSRSGDWLP
jgi:hypothetical protein